MGTSSRLKETDCRGVAPGGGCAPTSWLEAGDALRSVKTREARDRAMTTETHTLGVPPGLPLPAVREFLRGVDGHLPDRTRETLALLLTEAVTNARRHGGPPVELEVTWLAGTARLVVRSGGPRFRWHGPPPARGEGGWGLVLVDRMSDRWGIKHDADGNEVWLEVDH